MSQSIDELVDNLETYLDFVHGFNHPIITVLVSLHRRNKRLESLIYKMQNQLIEAGVLPDDRE